MPVSRHAARFLEGNRMLEMTNENFARLLRGLTIAVGNRRNRNTLVSVSCSRDQGFALFIWGRRRRVLQKSPNVAPLHLGTREVAISRASPAYRPDEALESPPTQEAGRGLPQVPSSP